MPHGARIAGLETGFFGSVEKLLAHDGPAYALAIFSYEANVTHVRSRGTPDAVERERRRKCRRQRNASAMAATIKPNVASQLTAPINSSVMRAVPLLFQ